MAAGAVKTGGSGPGAAVAGKRLVYRRRPGARLRVDPQTAGERLEYLRELHGGLTAKIVVNDARSPGSPLHRQFQWDNDIAAEEYRENQARYLIRSIFAVVEDLPGHPEPIEVPAFMLVVEDGHRHYEAFATVISDVDLWEQQMRAAYAEWQRFARKYRRYVALAEIFEAADAVWKGMSKNG